MPTTKQAKLSELRVGLLVVISLAILIFVIFTVSGDIKLPGVHTTTIVRTRMSSVDGLREGAEVRLSGKKVGSVRAIQFSSEIPQNVASQDNIEIIMEIDGRLDGRPAIERIRSDSLAVLKGAGVLGDNVIDITPGTSRGVPIRDGDSVKSQAQKSVGDILNAAQTAVSNLNEISDDIRVMTGNLRDGKGTMGRFLTDDSFFVDLDKTVRQAESLIATFREGKGTVGKLLNEDTLYREANQTVVQLRKISDQLHEQMSTGKGTVGKLFKDEELYQRANSLVKRLDETAVRLDSTLAKVERGEGNLGKLLTDEKLYNDTRETVERLKNIAGGLERGEGTAGLLLKDEKLYQNLNTMSAEVTKLLYDFRQNPRKYLSVKVAIF
ncbi:MAG: MlaD family protein [Blastocatellia bacterium]|jgi:phospholipid/cholesterol/gamma-HCH transport system substrate-binding protein